MNEVRQRGPQAQEPRRARGEEPQTLDYRSNLRFNAVLFFKAHKEQAHKNKPTKNKPTKNWEGTGKALTSTPMLETGVCVVHFPLA